MRVIVICKNCGLKWVHVTSFGPEIELTEDLQYCCPSCSSNWYEPIPGEDITDAG